MKKDLQNSIDHITAKTGRKSGFTVPKNYFENLENSVSVAIAEDGLSKTKGFEVPDNYFATLEDVILSKIESIKEPTKIISFRTRIVRFIPIAAVASILLFLGLYFYTSNSDTLTFDDLATADLEIWIEEDYFDINNSDLVAVFEASDFNNQILNINSIDEDEIENYLNNIETTTLLNDIY